MIATNEAETSTSASAIRFVFHRLTPAGGLEAARDIDIDRLTELPGQFEASGPVDRIALGGDQAADVLLILRTSGKGFHHEEILDDDHGHADIADRHRRCVADGLLRANWMPRDSNTRAASASVGHRAGSMGYLVEAAKGLHLQDAFGECLPPGTIVHRLPVSGRDTRRPDRGEQVIGYGNAVCGRETVGPLGIPSPNPLAAERLEQFPPLTMAGRGWIGGGVGIGEVAHGSDYTARPRALCTGCGQGFVIAFSCSHENFFSTVQEGDGAEPRAGGGGSVGGTRDACRRAQRPLDLVTRSSPSARASGVRIGRLFAFRETRAQPSTSARTSSAT